MNDMSSSPALATSEEAVAELRSNIRGQVLLPGDAVYDASRKGFNLSVDQYPALIVVPESAQDIAQAVLFANRIDLDIAVTATGHGTIRPADSCLLINTSRMTAVTIDEEAGTARVEAGAKWGRVLGPAQAAGLAPLLGSSPDVGAVGYTLGGGLGWLGRKYGLAADSVIEFEVVTAEGRQLRANASENSDLFWGLRGGGGSLVIVSALTFKLYPISNVYGGNLIYPMEMAGEVMARYRQWIDQVPDEMTSSVVLMNVPPLPVAPEFLRGKSVIFVRGCYCGPEEEGRALIDSWRQWREPMVDMFGPMPFSNVAQISSDPEDPIPGSSSGAWLRELDDAAIDTLISYVKPSGGPPPIIMAEVRHAGGAISRVDPASAAFGNRDQTLLLFYTGMTPTPEAREGFAQHSARMKEALAPSLSGRVYINFLEGSESAERVKDAFSAEALERLSELKARYDPDNRLNRAVNIKPGG